MHELSLVVNLVEIAEEKIKHENEKKIVSVDVVVGKISGVDSESLIFAFYEVVKNRSLWSNSKINIEFQEIKIYCGFCDKFYYPTDLDLFCPYCENYSGEIIEGKDFFFKSMTLN